MRQAQLLGVKTCSPCFFIPLLLSPYPKQQRRVLSSPAWVRSIWRRTHGLWGFWEEWKERELMGSLRRDWYLAGCSWAIVGMLLSIGGVTAGSAMSFLLDPFRGNRSGFMKTCRVVSCLPHTLPSRVPETYFPLIFMVVVGKRSRMQLSSFLPSIFRIWSYKSGRPLCLNLVAQWWHIILLE